MLDFQKLLNNSLRVFFKDALRVAFTNPSQAYFFFQTLRRQQKETRVREKWELQGIRVPPIMIFSITDRCNLHCKGCYNQALRQSPQTEMSEEKLRSIFDEAVELGISFIVLGGGEPLMRREILDITMNYPEIVFLLFTNGLLIDEDVVARLNKQKNLVPIISLEGYQADTDDRRGIGVYDRLLHIVEKIKSTGLFWGTSLTMTRTNYATLSERALFLQIS